MRAVAAAVKRLVWHKFGAAFAVLFAVLVTGFTLLATAAGYSLTNALYLTFLDAAGAAVTNPGLAGPEKVAQFLLTFDGMAFHPGGDRRRHRRSGLPARCGSGPGRSATTSWWSAWETSAPASPASWHDLGVDVVLHGQQRERGRGGDGPAASACP